MNPQQLANVGNFGHEKWGLVLIDPLLPEPVYWTLHKPRIVVSFTRGQLVSVIF